MTVSVSHCQSRSFSSISINHHHLLSLSYHTIIYSIVHSPIVQHQNSTHLVVLRYQYDIYRFSFMIRHTLSFRQLFRQYYYHRNTSRSLVYSVISQSTIAFSIFYIIYRSKQCNLVDRYNRSFALTKLSYRFVQFHVVKQFISYYIAQDSHIVSCSCIDYNTTQFTQ